MKIVEVKHPLVKHKLGLMREHDISTKRFRELASEVGSLLTYEATADLETEKVTIEGWNGPVEVEQIKGKKITVVPILRAGLGMMEGVLEHVPSARISVVGIYRNEETLEPVPYFQKLVSNIDERMALVVDPMLATGGSMIATIDLLKNAGCTSIKVLVLLPLGYEVALGGFIMCGVLFCLVSFIVKKAGTGWLDVMFPPAAMGAIVAVIGLELAGVAANMAGLLPADGQSPDSKTIIISMVTLAVTVFGSVLFRGFLAIIPILIGVLVGYALSFVMGVVDTTPIAEAHWFALPTFYTPRFEWFAIFTILPAALVVIAEHVGHLVVTANIVKRDLIRDPGLHRSMFANGLSTIVSGFFGSTPNTTYGENIGVMAITRVYSTWVIGGAAIIAILLSCVGKLAAAIQIIPVPVMGGVSLLLYGVIGASGIRVLIESKVDYSKAQNLILTSVILIIGVSGAKVHIGAAELKGMALATIVGIALSLIFKLISVLRPEEVVLDAADSEEFK